MQVLPLQGTIMATAAPTKAKAKTNTARPALSKKNPFSPRVLAVLVLSLVIVLGFVYVLFSKASTLGSWGPDKLQVWHGTITTKSNGVKQVSTAKAPDPVVGNWSSLNVMLTNFETGNVVSPGTYCATGTAPAGSRIRTAFSKYGQSGGGDNETYDPTKSQAINNGAAGAFEICVPLIAPTEPRYATYTYVGFTLYAPGVSSTLVLDKIYQKSATSMWYPNNMGYVFGNKVIKSDLTQQVVGVPRTDINTVGTWNNINGYISEPLTQNATYCAVGTAPAGSHYYSYTRYGEFGGGYGDPFDPRGRAALSVNSMGKYEICSLLPTRAQNQYGYSAYYGFEVWSPVGTQLTLDYIYLKSGATSTSTPTVTPTATVAPTMTLTPAPATPTPTPSTSTPVEASPAVSTL